MHWTFGRGSKKWIVCSMHKGGEQPPSDAVLLSACKCKTYGSPLGKGVVQVTNCVACHATTRVCMCSIDVFACVECSHVAIAHCAPISGAGQIMGAGLCALRRQVLTLTCWLCMTSLSKQLGHKFALVLSPPI